VTVEVPSPSVDHEAGERARGSRPTAPSAGVVTAVCAAEILGMALKNPLILIAILLRLGWL
jgi:hypothetical protein